MSTSNDDPQILWALCQAEDVRLRHRVRKIRGDQECVNAENRVNFEACTALTRFRARINPPSLAAQFTRAGFPDVDLDPLLEPLPWAAAELVGRLTVPERRER